MNDYILAIVKWFGGINIRTGKNIEYGFLQGMDGNDIFVHKSSISDKDTLLEKDELVICKIFYSKKGFSSEKTIQINQDKEFIKFLNIYRLNKEKYSVFFIDDKFHQSLSKLLNDYTYYIIKDENIFDVLDILKANDQLFIESLKKYAIIKKNNISFQKYLIRNKSNLDLKFVSDPEIYDILSKDEVTCSLMKEVVISNIDNLNSYNVKFILDNNLLDFSSIKEDISLFEKVIKNELISGKFLTYVLNSLQNGEDNIAVEKLINSNEWHSIIESNLDRKDLIDFVSNKLPLKYIPTHFIKGYDTKIYESIIKNIENDENYFFDNIEYLSEIIILKSYCNFKFSRSIPINILNKSYNNLMKYCIYNCNTDSFLNELLDDFISKIKTEIDKPPSNELYEKIQFIIMLYEKNPNIKNFYEQSLYIKNIKYFILSNLFSLVISENDLDTVYEVFLSELWIELIENKIDLNVDYIRELFPSCGTFFNGELSCEAFHWQNNIFLCRGKRCRNPRVVPQIDKNFLTYNIFDWFAFYGINYDNGVPQKIDFPIKLAGYFNRLREIYSILKCRECTNIMIPNFKYARKTYMEYDPQTNDFVIKKMNASYRVTVFQCITESCDQNKKSYYINHCIGYNCYSLIDSRDLRVKCPHDRYICKACGSCCADCSKENNNNGRCPECSKFLLIDYSEPKIYCQNENCKFEFSGINIPKRFESKLKQYIPNKLL